MPLFVVARIMMSLVIDDRTSARRVYEKVNDVLAGGGAFYGMWSR